MSKFNDDALVKLAWSHFHLGLVKTMPPVSLNAKNVLTDSQRNAVVEYLGGARADRPVTVKQMKAEISAIIGVELSEPYNYGATVSRQDLIKIHAWIKTKAGQ
jgi:hypothetical protein